MQIAAKYGLPIISFIDTPGAFPGITAEERGQAAIIAENLMAMSQIRAPIVCIVIGEGGSGGALGIGIGDRLAMLEFTYYSVITPEGCASILWKGSEHAPKAAAALKMTSRDLLRFGIVDEVIPEPLGGAHRDHREAAASLKTYLIHAIRQLKEFSLDDLLDRRYDKYRKIGVFFEEVAPPERNGRPQDAAHLVPPPQGGREL
jgi:acetyl-CoA carboxylase carboxyl transferase subunit alpha